MLGEGEVSNATDEEWISPPAIAIPPSFAAISQALPNSAALVSVDCNEHDVIDPSPAASCFSYSPASTVTTPCSTRAGRSASTALLANDREIVSRVWSSTQLPSEVQTLDLSMAMKKTRRALKSFVALAEFGNLTALDVSNNAIADVHGVDVFVHLEVLVLSRNHLKKVTQPLFSLSLLRDLDLSGNFIAHIPRAISKLEMLERLNVSGNSLSTLKEVDALASLANLHDCNLSANPFCKLPTYRDYVVFKLAGIETLDGITVTLLSRDKSRRRFFDAAFAKDAQLREVGEAHESEQTRLREAQSVLEAENLRLKGELQVKSQLLQNKSRAWSDATERLLQLQQEIAMLNLERQQQEQEQESRTGTAFDYAVESPISGRRQQPIASSGRSSSSPALHSRTTTTDGIHRYDERTHPQATYPLSPANYHYYRQNPFTNSMRVEDSNSQNSIDLKSESNLQVSRPSEVYQASNHEDELMANLHSQTTTLTKECTSLSSPLRSEQIDTCTTLEKSEDIAERTTETIPVLTAGSTQSPELPVYRSDNFYRVRRAFSAVEPNGTAFLGDIELRDEETVARQFSRRPSQFPTVEDDLECPAYEEQTCTPTMNLQEPSPPSRPLNNFSTGFKVATSTTPYYRASSSPGRLISMSSPSEIKSPSQRIWERQHRDFRNQILSSPRNTRSPKKNNHTLTSNKNVLIQQTQALQSCKQALLKEIAKEEELLHGLKQQEREFANRVENVETNIQACIDAARADEQASLELPYTVSSSGSPRATARRKDNAVMAQIEALRNKLRLVEDREKEIEMAMVRKTKRVLETDVAAVAANMGVPLGSVTVAANTAFDKEIFALTNKLQLTIVQKEELQLEMARLMGVLRDQHRRPSVSNDDGGKPGQTQNRPSSRRNSRTGRQGQDSNPSLEQSYKLLTGLRLKHQEISDRIRVKEDLLASLVDELRDVDAELEHIGGANGLSQEMNQCPSPIRRQRSASFDCLQEIQAMLRFSDVPALDVKSPNRKVTQLSLNHTSKTGLNNSTADAIQQSPQNQELGDEQMNISPDGIGGSVPTILNLKDILTAEMLEAIKKEVFEKLSEQFTALTSVVGGASGDRCHREQRDLHNAIATALDAHMKAAIDSYEKKKMNESRQAVDDEDGPEIDADRESPRNNNASPSHRQREERESAQNSLSDESANWDNFTELTPMEIQYPMKYRYIKYVDPFSGRHNSSKNSAAVAGTQRILKACERLDISRAECRINPSTLIEIDPSGNNKSSLKVLLMGARDLPTSHLRTKNLDPYVSLEIVYPDIAKKVREGQAVPSAMQSFRSRTQKKTMYPVWDEEFEFAPVLSLNGYLHLRILNDRKLSREQLVGEARIPLRTLLHQKRTAEWHPLDIRVPSTGTRRKGGTSKVISKTCNGTVRVQLHLTFSRVEKYKRVVDELVTKFLHEHNHLPPFIETVDAAPDANQEHPEQDEPDSAVQILGDTHSINTYQDQEGQQQWQSGSGASNFPLSELETSLSAYGRWRTDTVDDFRVTPINRCLPKDEGPPYDPKELSAPAIRCGLAGRQSIRDDHASRSQQRHLQLQPQEMLQPDDQDDMSSQAAPAHCHSPSSMHRPRRASVPSKSSHPRSTQSQTMPAYRSHTPANRRPSGLNLSATCTRRTPKANVDHEASSHHHHRPTTLGDECFDEYSPYHPAFQFVDMFDGGNNDFLSKQRRKPTPSFTPSVVELHHRKTDLRIFKSPGFSRRQPTAGFPERYIGLDSQTCERLKRMFGRIDAPEPVFHRRPAASSAGRR